MNSVFRSKGSERTNKTIERIVTVLVLAALLSGLAFGMSGRPVYGLSSGDIKADFEGDYYATQGASGVYFSFEVTNTTNSDVSLYVELSGGNDISVISGNDKSVFILPAGQSKDCAFKADIARRASVGDHTLRLRIYEGETGSQIVERTGTVNIAEDMNPQNSAKNPAVDITYSLSDSDGITAGASNTLNLQIFNRGNTVIKNAQIGLGLPEGMSIHNAVGTVNAGYIAVGSTYRCKFPIMADEDLASKNYPITVKVDGADSSNDSVRLEQTLYIPVKGGTAASSAKDVEIGNISIPQQVVAGDEFTLSFDIANRGKSKLADTKVTVEVPEGLANKTKNVFMITGLEAGKTQKCSVKLFGTDKAENNAYKLIKITAESPSGDSSVSVSQYAGTMVKSLGGSAKTPQLMVSDYSYGGTCVQAGDDFLLSLGIYNTSATQDLVNIKVTVSSEDGTFVPVQTSNSFYIDKINAKQTISHGLTLSAKRDSEQKTCALSVDMSYEDTAGNAFTSKDVISIPVTQETRLVVDDVVAPPELYAGMQSNISVQFYNMGKTVLNNLRVNVEGDFDAPQSNLYYVGNMETGKSDSYDFSFIPRQSGAMTGTIIFTYEDADGNEQRIEKTFEAEVMEEMPMDDFYGEDPPAEEPNKPWIPIVIGVAAVAAVCGIVLFRRHRKKKKDMEMEIDD